MKRPYWKNCVAHFDGKVQTFVEDYFCASDRRCLLIAAAGFDPRSIQITSILAKVLKERLEAIFIREERGRPDNNLVELAKQNREQLEKLVEKCNVIEVDVFSEDGAPVGGVCIARILANHDISPAITDIVLDMSAMSIGVGFPAARLLLEKSELNKSQAFHIMISSNPDLDDEIACEPDASPMVVKGFPGADTSWTSLETAQIWLPQLSKGKSAALNSIGRSIGECYKICPILPFPAQDPRRGDAIISEFGTVLVDEWQVDPRDFVHVSEINPLDCFRTLSNLAQRYR